MSPIVIYLILAVIIRTKYSVEICNGNFPPFGAS